MRIWRFAAAALLAFAVIAVWPSFGAAPASGQNHLHHASAKARSGPATHDHAGGAAHSEGRADCDPGGIGCCIMALCHPGIAATPAELFDPAMTLEPQAAGIVRADGNDPDLVPPPPRILLV